MLFCPILPRDAEVADRPVCRRVRGRPAATAHGPPHAAGRLPGDIRFRLRGREYSFPFASAVIFSLIAGFIGWLL
jgi:hypothetical protein